MRNTAVAGALTKTPGMTRSMAPVSGVKVTSRDGTAIAFDRIGSGETVILVDRG